MAPARKSDPKPGSTSARRSATIVARLIAALSVLVLLLLGLGVVAFWGMQGATREMRQVEQSFARVESVRAIEGAFSRYLLREIGRRLEGGGQPAESHEAGELRGALRVYQRAIGEGIAQGGPQEFEAERATLVRASALAGLFEAIETEAMLDRVRGPVFDAGASARDFMALIASDRELSFHALVAEALESERARGAQALARLEALRRNLVLSGGALALAIVLAAVGFGLVFYRGLMRPIRGLAAAAEAFGAGERLARAPEGLPGEFALLARRFDAMAERIDTEQGRLEAEVAARTAALETANAELTRIDAARRRFFANVSHELRTPVTVLLGEAQVALRAKSDEAHAALARIAASGGFLRRRLDDLMKLARSEDGQLSIAIARTDLNLAVGAAVETARAYASASEIAIAFAPAPVPAMLDGDAEALRQAALALIDNAVKFSPPGATVTVRVTPGGFSVADTGPGFGQDDAEAMFDRYAQADAGQRAGGAGLGLAIVRWIVEQHGGKVSARNGPDGGAIVEARIPA